MSAIESLVEKRKYPRIPLAIQYSLLLEGEHYTGVTGNIAQGGVYLQSISPPLQSDKISKTAEITLDLNSTSLSMECRIVYVGGGPIPYPEGVGVAFNDLDEETSTTLNEYILSNL